MQITCLRCGAKGGGKTISDAKKNVDHSIGLTISRPCGDNRAIWSSTESKIPQESPEPKAKKSKKSQNA